MNAEPATYTAPAGVGIELLDETLLDAFTVLRDALTGGRPAIALVRDADVLGQASSIPTRWRSGSTASLTRTG
jgi:hypothetical protein